MTKGKQIRIETKRFYLRPFEACDYKAWRQAHEEMLPKQNDFDLAARPKSKITRAHFIKLAKRDRDLRKRDSAYILRIFDKKSGELLGMTSVELITRGSQQTAWLSYVVHNNHWRKGVATEAVRATIDFAFHKLKLHRLEAPILPRNKPSIAFARSMGMRRECLSKKRMLISRKWEDLVIYVTLAEDHS